MKIETKQLRKTFGKESALEDLSITFSGEKIIGLLGKNGAGKTTFMRILSGHFQQTRGTIAVNEQSPFNHSDVSKNICFIQESNNFYGKFRIDEVLQIAEVFYPNWDKDQAEHLLKVFKLKRKQKVKALSKGMLSALGIIVGLASNASITIFDEPYIGLDASNRSLFYDLLLQSYQENPRMFILSTHLIDEISKLFEEVAILHEGKLLLHETTAELAENHLLVSGETSVVDQAIKNKNVIHETSMLGKKKAVLFGEQLATTDELEVSKIGLQDLVIYLTKEEVDSL